MQEDIDRRKNEEFSFRPKMFEIEREEFKRGEKLRKAIMIPKIEDTPERREKGKSSFIERQIEYMRKSQDKMKEK